MTSTPTPAHRIAAGDLVTVDRRGYRVHHVAPVAFYSRNRNVELAEADRHGVTLTLIPTRAAGGRHHTVTLRNNELISRKAPAAPAPAAEPMFETIAEFAFAIEAAAGPALGRLFA